MAEQVEDLEPVHQAVLTEKARQDSQVVTVVLQDLGVTQEQAEVAEEPRQYS